MLEPVYDNLMTRFRSGKTGETYQEQLIRAAPAQTVEAIPIVVYTNIFIPNTSPKQ